MLAYIIRRLLYVVPIVLGVSLITFILFNIVGGNPAYIKAGKNATLEEIRQIERELGVDKPLFVDISALKELRLRKAFDSQYVFYLRQIITFDFGRSWDSRQKISTMISEGLVPSLSLAVPAFFMGTIIAIWVSLFCAFLHNTWIDRSFVVLSIIGMSITTLAYIIAGQYFLAYRLKLFPIQGFVFGFGGVKYLILPALIWILAALGADVRFYRTVILEETNQDYVRTAFAKGLGRNSVLFIHVLKNSMIPIITRLTLALPFLYTGSLLLENFFGIPGLGSMALNAVNSSDFPVIKALVFIGSILFVLFNLLADILYGIVDPRIKLK